MKEPKAKLEAIIELKCKRNDVKFAIESCTENIKYWQRQREEALERLIKLNNEIYDLKDGRYES
jgi:chromosome segregation ATPase